MTGFYSTPEWKALRRRAVARDRFTCTKCGAPVHAKGASRVDHIVPVKARPDLALTLGNLRTLCVACDNKRHAEKGGHNRQREQFTQTGADGFPDPTTPSRWRDHE
jgi:5-methylcytosine-specific restriction endonuclease McrA